VTEERYECPEECGLRLREIEMVAHLKWDHNYREPEAERKVESL
jgi:hypothetical protein